MRHCSAGVFSNSIVGNQVQAYQFNVRNEMYARVGNTRTCTVESTLSKRGGAQCWKSRTTLNKGAIAI
jgi:hypothetical protein